MSAAFVYKARDTQFEACFGLDKDTLGGEFSQNVLKFEDCVQQKNNAY